MATAWLITSVQDGGSDRELTPADGTSSVMNKDGKEDFLSAPLHGRLGADSQSGKTIELEANISGRTAQSKPKRWLIRPKFNKVLQTAAIILFSSHEDWRTGQTPILD